MVISEVLYTEFHKNMWYMKNSFMFLHKGALKNEPN